MEDAVSMEEVCSVATSRPGAASSRRSSCRSTALMRSQPIDLPPPDRPRSLRWQIRDEPGSARYLFGKIRVLQGTWLVLRGRLRYRAAQIRHLDNRNTGAGAPKDLP